MQFVEFENLKIEYKQEAFDTIVFSQEDVLIVGDQNYVSFKSSNLELEQINDYEISFSVKTGFGFIKRKKQIIVKEFKEEFIHSLCTF